MSNAVLVNTFNLFIFLKQELVTVIDDNVPRGEKPVPGPAADDGSPPACGLSIEPILIHSQPVCQIQKPFFLLTNRDPLEALRSMHVSKAPRPYSRVTPCAEVLSGVDS
jgi:hypothetical protein